MSSFVPFDIVEANLFIDNTSFILVLHNLPINSLAGVCRKKKTTGRLKGFARHSCVSSGPDAVVRPGNFLGLLSNK